MFPNAEKKLWNGPSDVQKTVLTAPVHITHKRNVHTDVHSSAAMFKHTIYLYHTFISTSSKQRLQTISTKSAERNEILQQWHLDMRTSRAKDYNKANLLYKFVWIWFAGDQVDIRHLPWCSICSRDWQFLDPPSWRHASMWTMIGWGQTCKIRQDLMALGSWWPSSQMWSLIPALKPSVSVTHVCFSQSSAWIQNGPPLWVLER